MAIDMEMLSKLWTVKQMAEYHNTRPGIVRREAKKGEIPGMIEVLGKMGFNPDEAMAWTPPEPGTRGPVGARREDGRQRYHVYLTKEEFAALTTEGYEVADPREAAKARREARKAEKAAATSTDAPVGAEAENPFETFGLEVA